VPVSPVTVPPTVKDPEPGLPDLGTPLQAERTKEVSNRDTETIDLKWDFIAIDCSLGISHLRGCGQFDIFGIPQVRPRWTQACARGIAQIGIV
jgi:hypothetical protein